MNERRCGHAPRASPTVLLCVIVTHDLLACSARTTPAQRSPRPCRLASISRALEVERAGLAIFDRIVIADARLSARKNTQATTTERNVSAKAARLAASAQRGPNRRTIIVPGVVDAKIEAVQHAPDDERPARAVPQPAEQHRDHQVDVAQRRAVAIAAERDIEIVAQEPRQRHVPAPPEIDDAGGLVGRIEIERQEDAEHQRHADRHVGIAGEIEIELEGVGQRADPGLRSKDGVAGPKASATKGWMPSASRSS